MAAKQGTDWFQAYKTAYPEMYRPLAGVVEEQWGDASFRPDLVLTLPDAAAAAVSLPTAAFERRTPRRRVQNRM